MLLLTTYQEVPGYPDPDINNADGQRDFAFHGPAGMFRFIQETGVTRFECRAVEFVEPHDA